MDPEQFFEQAIRLTTAQINHFPPEKDDPVRIAELVRLNDQAVVEAWNDIQLEADDLVDWHH